ncbi:hypothetical protein GCM10027615_57600 [Plantactinospora veratri]
MGDGAPVRAWTRHHHEPVATVAPRRADLRVLQWVLVLYGRSAELSRLDEVIVRARDGSGGAVVLRGEAGVGKTALLDAAAARAGAMRVLRTTGIEPESDLAFAALHQVLWPVADSSTRCPNRSATR